jgi:RecA/RadA recombinase
MKRTKNNPESLATQMKRRCHATPSEEKPFEYEGNDKLMISTGSTLLDLAIAGGRVRGGGIPGGVIVEIFGPPSIGKTTLICEIAGNVQKKGGETNFNDPEGRLSSQFAKIHDYEIDEKDIKHPRTPMDIFPKIRKWEPKNTEIINGEFIDSTAALISDLELEEKKDEYQRRAKLFSQELRKSAIPIAEKNLLVVASNQLRQNMDSGPFGEKYSTPGGEAWKFYSSLRLKCSKSNPFKIQETVKLRGKEHKQTIGTAMDIYVAKSSIWIGYLSAPVYLLNNYGIDDIRANLIYLKQYGPKVKKDNGVDYSGYTLNGEKLAPGINDAIDIIEKENAQDDLKETVIDLWEEIQSLFRTDRRKRR